MAQCRDSHYHASLPEGLMRVRMLVVAGVSVVVAAAGLQAAKPHVNPMVELLEQKQGREHIRVAMPRIPTPMTTVRSICSRGIS